MSALPPATFFDLPPHSHTLLLKLPPSFFFFVPSLPPVDIFMFLLHVHFNLLFEIDGVVVS